MGVWWWWCLHLPLLLSLQSLDRSALPYAEGTLLRIKKVIKSKREGLRLVERLYSTLSLKYIYFLLIIIFAAVTSNVLNFR